MTESRRRIRRPRAGAPAAPAGQPKPSEQPDQQAEATAPTASAVTVEPVEPVERDDAPGRRRPARERDAERGLRGLVGAGPSQVGVSGAMRARDVSRPSAEDLAAAAESVVLVRRGYVPPAPDAPSAGRSGRSGSRPSRS